MTGLATPNFLSNAKFETKCCIVFVFFSVVLRYILIFAFLNRERVFLEMTGLQGGHFSGKPGKPGKSLESQNASGKPGKPGIL